MSVRSSSSMKAWTLRLPLTAPKIAPSTSDWHTGSISTWDWITELESFWGRKWRGWPHPFMMHSTGFPLPPALGLVQCQGACPDRFTFVGGLSSTGFQRSTHYKKRSMQTDPFLHLLPTPAFPAHCYSPCLYLFLIFPVFLYANISKFPYISPDPHLSYMKVP